jgi:hypothetical protein
LRLIIGTLLLSGAAFAADISLANLTFDNANSQKVTYRNHAALKLTSQDGMRQALAIVPNITFRDGSIDVDVAGTPAAGAGPDARGFIGVAFRQQKDRNHFENIYIRPTNGRADDQLRRNHTLQYASEPDWPWERLRKETPGMYESYADMQAGEWTHMRIVVKGRDASLYIDRATEPCLIVHDLKLGLTEGGVALWIFADTEGYFRDLKITN